MFFKPIPAYYPECTFDRPLRNPHPHTHTQNQLLYWKPMLWPSLLSQRQTHMSSFFLGLNADHGEMAWGNEDESSWSGKGYKISEFVSRLGHNSRVQAPIQDSNKQPTGLLLSGTGSKGMAHETCPGTFLNIPFKWFLLFSVIMQYMNTEEK